jgi:hypothetical protein
MQTSRDVRRYAYDLVKDDKTQYHMLDEEEKGKITGLIIRSTEKINVWEYITEADFKNELPYLLAEYLETGSIVLGEAILKTLRDNAILYASKEIISFLDEQEKEWEQDKLITE